MVTGISRWLVRWLAVVLVSGGAALASAAITMSPREFDLGELQVGIGGTSIAFAIVNSGTTEVRFHVRYPNRGGDVALACTIGGTYSWTLPPGASCDVDLFLAAPSIIPPGTLGPGTSTVELIVNGGEQQVALTLHWTAVRDYVEIDETPHDFGAVTVGEAAATTRIIRNNARTPMSIVTLLRMWPDFSCNYLYLTAHIAHPTCNREHPIAATSIRMRLEACEPIPPGGACTVHIEFDPQGPFSMRGQFELFYEEAGGRSYGRNVQLSGTGVARPAVPGTQRAVEYYNPVLQHYFVTAYATEQAALDAGGHGGWVRSGRSFWVHPPERVAEAGANPVCRYYGVPGVGPNSHFYSAIAAECEAVPRLYPDAWLLESANVFGAGLPDAAGRCPPGTSPLFRLYNNRRNANHRYTTDPLIPGDMFGWVREGFGTLGVAMCVPQ